MAAEGEGDDMRVSQKALARRADKSVKWIRAMGHVAFTITNGNGEKEVWQEARRYSSGRLAGYDHVSTTKATP
jgi:hypothetical protein